MMKHFRTLLLLLVVILNLSSSVYQLKGPIMIAVLLPKDTRRPFSINRVRPAIDIAVEKILAPNGLLHGHTIELNYADSMCSSADAMNAAINFYVQNKSHIFFGPCCDYAAAPIGRQTKFWNIPMITTALARDFAVLKADKYSMMTRVGSSINKMADFFNQMFKEFKWHQVKILYQPKGLDYLADHMCHVTAESLHFTLVELYQYRIPYYKFETTQAALADMQEQIGTEHAATWEDEAADRTKWRYSLRRHLRVGQKKLSRQAEKRRKRRNEHQENKQLRAVTSGTHSHSQL